MKQPENCENKEDNFFSSEKEDHHMSFIDKEQSSLSGMKDNECEKQVNEEVDSSSESISDFGMEDDTKQDNKYHYSSKRVTNNLNLTKDRALEADLLSESRTDKYLIPSKIVSRRPLFQNQKVSSIYKFFEKTEKYKWIILTLIVGVLASAAVYIFTPTESTNKKMTANNNVIEALRNKLFEKYPSNKDLLKELFFLINYMNNSEIIMNEPITILYTHQDTAECLANDIGKYAANVFRNRNELEKLNGSKIDENFSLSCKDFRNNINKKGVLIVYNFHAMPVDKVRLFHGICDKYSPFSSNKSVFIILLETNENQKEIPKLMKKLYSRMYELWSSYLELPFLEPLIVRLSENIVDVKEENNLLEC